jgi:tetratricopeptide (TPR) repeat protein
MNRRSLGTVLVSLATLVTPGMALARSPNVAPEASEVGDASKLIEHGIALRKAGDDARALEKFQQAERVEPDSTRVRVHLAAVYQALGNWEAADRYLTLALEDPSDPYVQKHQGILANARRTIDGHIGSLELTGGPRGTEILLNGRLVGRLPLQQAIRVQAGIYALEARLPGHYPITRSIALAGGALARESIELSPLSGQARSPSPIEEGFEDDTTTREANWLSWTFAGLAAGASVGAVAAWAIREQHVDNYNDDSACLRMGQTREQVCGDEREAGDNATTWMWIGGAAAAAFTTASLLTILLSDPSEEEAPPSALSCGVGLAQIACSGRF